VAVTIDDLPVGQSGARGCDFDRLQPLTRALLAPIREQRVPVTAFIIAGNCPGLTLEQRRAIFSMWKDAGAEFGNHSYSHPDLNSMPIAEYESDIQRADTVLRTTLQVPNLRWFRSPMLHTGADLLTKRRLETFLKQNGWRQAPVTYDNAEWMFAYVFNHAVEHADAAMVQRVRESYLPYLESVIAFFEQRSVEVVGREFPQVLLLHANRLNSEMLGELLQRLKRRGYAFVDLETALRDPAYSLPDEYAGRGGFSWIHRWSMTKGLPNKGEPDEPAWLRREYERLTQTRR
jgi:peptidoglycan/xylan/chitin deacetylase (PgdA/CDA1 family)